ncbi:MULTISPECIES: DUF4233 domain-containing protein [Thermocrispum]|jgi:hypothetical protein|uniref:DUF4233 domain-containing protein n=1 Tax=Thermocrispum agreste TaxID=37925 RepID=A0A2W4JQU2_9PSEU|nr:MULTISPECIES: DUF4233 domain-containing protein [Thermocrispum]PZN01433.1 MAG: DUF4233 domain-containing protein [Thermocrispum agreste]
MSEDAVPEREQAPKDPMKGFRGVMSGTLVMEAITLGLALPVIDRLGDGLTSVTGWLVGGLAVVLLVLCAFVRSPRITETIVALQLVLVVFVVVEPPVGIIGIVFLVAWLILFRLRAKVAEQIAGGTLPSTRQGE